MTQGIRLVGFDADDTLWRSQDYFDEAQRDFEAIVGQYVDLGDGRVADALYAVESANIAVFGYGVKGMALSMIESATQITEGRITARDLHRIVEMAKGLLRHPVELLPGIREAVEAIAARFDVVLITKGDLFHQEAKVRDSGLSDLFRRIEIVSEKDAPTYARVLTEFEAGPGQFLMIGNSLRSDIAPVLALGGWGVHMPYRTTWAHETDVSITSGLERMCEVAAPEALPPAVLELATRAIAL
ncbi:haloacid dehalogenase [Lysobacteraceae bacterium NML93-0792]|nr:haloacid dehalogenase [Xanthomonadaceae bacterium NML93-0792]PBS14948.1 haloacid dehalogenase [Xanthomonadaceae bacterium NML93-0793]PBS18693.1 haloacid dehalogenase [Xanthomonadaceae bacterium NML93-0831]